VSTDGQGTKCRRNIAENHNRLRRVHERYRQTDRRRQTDGRATAYSERELFTFAKKQFGATRIGFFFLVLPIVTHRILLPDILYRIEMILFVAQYDVKYVQHGTVSSSAICVGGRMQKEGGECGVCINTPDLSAIGLTRRQAAQ